MRKNIRWKTSKKDIFITALLLAVTTLFCHVIGKLHTGENTYVPLLYVLAVLLVSRFTEGYGCGIVAAIIAVLGVNYMFTYPYMAFNFTLAGYPITFIVMLTVALTTSTLTSYKYEKDMIKRENDREKMRSNLLRAISHDLRTPLTSIIGSVGAVLERQELSEKEQHELLTDVKENAEWLIRMVENLLSVTRIENGAAKIKKTPEAVEEVVSEALVKFKKRFPNVNTKVSVPERVLFVPMDAVLIEQVIFNLLENAVIHGKTTKNIRMSVNICGKNAVFSVKDDGAGIREDTIPHLFTDYFDSKRMSYSTEKRNMGIGLSVCQSIIKVHGGNISGKNCEEGGAEFRFLLPLE